MHRQSLVDYGKPLQATEAPASRTKPWRPRAWSVPIKVSPASVRNGGVSRPTEFAGFRQLGAGSRKFTLPRVVGTSPHREPRFARTARARAAPRRIHG